MYDCEKCLHEEMCDQSSRHLWGTLNGEKDCSDFKNRNNYVEVVRCKDCKHGIWDEEEQMWECILSVDLTGDSDTYAMFHEYNDGDDFCSYGERKDNAK